MLIVDFVTFTKWGRMTHICISKLTIIASDDGGCHQAIIWTNAGIMLFGPIWKNFNEVLIEKQYIFIQ